MLPRLLLAAAAAVLIHAAPATALLRLPVQLPPVAGNPADALAGRPIEPSVYEGATHCAPKPRKGTQALVAWLQATSRGTFWGSYRCEEWGHGSASLHAENRAVDWALDATKGADRRAARRLVLLLLAPDAAGEPQALARRMGVEELIWDCGYWGAGMTAFKPYGPCYDAKGRLKDHVDPTAGHRDHVHIGLTRAGSRGRTSFWAARLG